MELKHFEKLNAIDVNKKTEKKKNGSIELTYLSWAWAWTEVKKNYPNAKYEILKFGEKRLPYVYDEKTGYMVFTRVEIENIEHEMWLPVMDSCNKAMLDKAYTYSVKEYKNYKWTGNYAKKQVESATMFDINKTIMRCLTKNLAMFGLGLYIYAGEDLPENIENEDPQVRKNSDKAENQKAEILILNSQKEIIKENFTEEQIRDYLLEVKKGRLGQLTIQEASNFIKRNGEN